MPFHSFFESFCSVWFQDDYSLWTFGWRHLSLPIHYFLDICSLQSICSVQTALVEDVRLCNSTTNVMPDYKLRKRKIQKGYFKVFKTFHRYLLFLLVFELPAGILPMTYLCGTASVMGGMFALQRFYLTLPACVMWPN